MKGKGCLQDKRYPDRFNIRVITRNGKLDKEKVMKKTVIGGATC